MCTVSHTLLLKSILLGFFKNKKKEEENKIFSITILVRFVPTITAVNPSPSPGLSATHNEYGRPQLCTYDSDTVGHSKYLNDMPESFISNLE